MKRILAALTTLIATIVGAGILAIPYVTAQSGFLLGVINLIIVAAIMTLINLYLAEVGLRTKNNQQLAGYAEHYLGKRGKTLMFIALFGGIQAALLAYLIVEGESISFILLNTTKYKFYAAIAFWSLLFILTHKGRKAFEKVEKINVLLILAVVLILTLTNSTKIKTENLTTIDLSHIFAPFGVIFFAFLGFAAIPEVERILANHKEKTKRTIITANLIILILYILFTLTVLGTQGSTTAHIATLSLGKPLILFGILTIFGSSLALATALIDSLTIDYNLPKRKAVLTTLSLPLILFIALTFFNKTLFIKILSLGGLLSGSLTAIIILIMVKKAKSKGNRKPEFSLPYSNTLTAIIIALLILATFLEIRTLF